MIEDDEDLTPEEKLFAYAEAKGAERARIMEKANVKVAARLSALAPERYALLLLKLTGWTPLSDFKKRVDTTRAENRKNFEAAKKDKELTEALNTAKGAGLTVVKASDPNAVASGLLEGTLANTVFRSKVFLKHDMNHYREASTEEIRSVVRKSLQASIDEDTGAEVIPFRVDVDEVVDAIRGSVYMDDTIIPPLWLPHEDSYLDPDERFCLPMKNGIYDMQAGKLMPNTPRFFTTNGLGFDYDPNAPVPARWLQFLEDAWPVAQGGQQEHDFLQEWMGYCLTTDTKYQSFALFTGVPGSGKSLVTAVMGALIGSANVVETQAEELGKDNGLAPLIGKQLAILGDTRIGRRDNLAGVIGSILRIVGEDTISIRRLYIGYWKGKLKTRITLVSNMAMVLPDQSGAIQRRLFPLTFHRSFTNDANRDVTLGEKLCQPESLKGILNWAIAGLVRLEGRRNAAGYHVGFIRPDRSKEVMRSIAVNTTTVLTFLDECCDLGGEYIADRAALFDFFENWAAVNNVSHAYMADSFSRELVAATGNAIEVKRTRDGAERRRVFVGVRLKPELEGETWEETTEG